MADEADVSPLDALPEVFSRSTMIPVRTVLTDPDKVSSAFGA